MPPSNLPAALEALLFSSDQPLPLSLISESLDLPVEDLGPALAALGESYADRASGVELREIAGGWMLVTTAEQSEWVGRLLRGKKRMRLSRAALETMAIIAYKQPVTKSEVEAIRGVDSTGVLATLLERNLVTIRGRSKTLGRPLLYGTTPEFLDYFGLRDLAELPRPEELRALVAAREPEQLEMMELEVVSQVASDLAAAELAAGERPRRQVLPLEDEPPTEHESGEERRHVSGAVLESDDDVDEYEEDEYDEDEIVDEVADDVDPEGGQAENGDGPDDDDDDDEDDEDEDEDEEEDDDNDNEDDFLDDDDFDEDDDDGDDDADDDEDVTAKTGGRTVVTERDDRS